MRKTTGLVFDLLCRNLKNLWGFVHDLEAQGVQFVLLTENLDTTFPMGGWCFRASEFRPGMNGV